MKKTQRLDESRPRHRLGSAGPRGLIFAWMPVPEGFTSEGFSDFLLEKAHVVMAPGKGFGAFGEGYVRVGLLTSEERLREAADRIAELNIFKKSEVSH